MTRPAQKLTQSQRSEKSRRKLVEATVHCLIEKGYAGTSTQLICDRAGLSKGGLFRQFASRSDLMIATARFVYDQLIGDFTQRYETYDGEISAKIVVRLIQQVFQSAAFQAVLELTIASRTDPTLKAGLVPIIQENITTVLALARSIFPAAAAKNARFDAVIHLLIMAFQGEVIDDLIYNTDHLAQSRFEFLVEIAERELE